MRSKLRSNQRNSILKQVFLKIFDKNNQKKKIERKRICNNFANIDDKNRFYNERPIKKIYNKSRTDIFLQLNEIDEKNNIKNIDKKNKIFIDKNNAKNNFSVGTTNKNQHIKISLNDHGNSVRKLSRQIEFGNFKYSTDNTKSFFISNTACHGAFYDDNGNSLFDIVKEQIKDKNCIGFVSLLKSNYTLTSHTSIDNNNKIGLKRIPHNDNIIDISSIKYNKNDYFEYYCILNKTNEKTGQIEQNIYKIPAELCYWREDLIDKKDKKYGNKFMRAFHFLKQRTEKKDGLKEFVFRNDVILNNGNNEKVNIPIIIPGEIYNVEVKAVKQPIEQTNYLQYEIKRKENINNKKTTNTNSITNESLLNLID